jgi:hypothetical protein
MSTLAQRNLQLLHLFINDYITNHKYTLISNLENITKTTDKFEYKCLCGNTQNHSKQNLKCIFDKYENWYPECCIKANLTGDYKWYFDPNIKNEYVDSQTKDIWKQYEGIWISNKGKCIGIEGDELTVNPTTTEVRTKKVMFRLPDIMAKLFKVQKYELLNEKNKYYARFGENNDLDYNIENLVILKVSEIKSKNRQHKNHTIKDDQTESPIDKNIPHKELDFCPGYTIFSDGKIWQKNTETFKSGNKWKDLTKNSAGNIILKFKKENEEHSYLVKRLVIIAFKPYNNLTKYEDYDKLEIIHLNGDINDCNVSNLFVQEPLTSEQKKKNKIKDRINELHSSILEFVKKRKGSIIEDEDEFKLENITKGTQSFKYKCRCDQIFIKKINDVKFNMDADCVTCRLKFRYSDTVKEEEFKIDDEIFKKGEVCYVSNKGKFLSFDKKQYYTPSFKDNLVKINKKEYNAKIMIAVTFKIEYYEYLVNNPNYEFYVKFKVENKGFVLNNLYVWASSKENRKLLLNNKKYFEGTYKEEIIGETIPDSETDEDFYKRRKFIETPLDPNTEYIILDEIPNHKIYRDGTIFSMNSYLNQRSRGSIANNGYYTCTIQGINYKVHRLVCYAFNKLDGYHTFEDYNDLEVNHKNGLKYDNRFDNLEWTTKSENINHAIENGMTDNVIPVLQYSINEDGSKKDFIKRHACLKWASDDSKQSVKHIRNVASGISKPYLYLWEFDNNKK